MNVLKWLKIKSTIRLFNCRGEWPFSRIDWKIVWFPNTIHNSKINYWRLIENSSRMVEMFREKIKMSRSWSWINSITLPYTVLKFNNRVIDKKRDGYICLNIHLILNSHKKLTIFSFILWTQSRWDKSNIQNINISIHNKLRHSLFGWILVSVIYF